MLLIFLLLRCCLMFVGVNRLSKNLGCLLTTQDFLVLTFKPLWDIYVYGLYLSIYQDVWFSKNNFHDLRRCVKNENEFMQKEINRLQREVHRLQVEINRSQNRQRRDFENKASLFQDRIENTVIKMNKLVERVTIVEILIKEMHTYSGN